ncbi:GGDEF domain-containing protein [Pseudomonas matsuisoli]|uniref:diguanylate cyclase n=1 Tax=Pseudomonas matsuisoli TaxID=1515666 RepID=A0A917PU04_9PSED|nr:diguanylate cyclase [Pseudomonas matsuisoli]GGJ91797.1 response regulator [Pseudomonas matsuisoli]
MPFRHRLIQQYVSTRVERLAIVFTLSVMLIFVLAVAWQLERSYRQGYDDARVNTANLALAVDQHVQDVVKQADQILYAMVERVEWDGASPQQLDRMHKMLFQQVQVMPQLHGLFIYGPDGQWLASSLGERQTRSNADREYFRYHRASRDKAVHVGPVINSRTTGDLIIPISRRIEDEDGHFAGVALVTFKVQYFLDFYDDFDLGTDGLILLALRDGTVLVRRPFDASVIGTSLANGRVFADLLPRAPIGSDVFSSKVDHIERVFAYRALGQDIPLVVEAAIATDDIHARWLRSAWASAVVVAIVIGGMGLFGWALVRQIRGTLRSEEELRQARDVLEKLAMQDGLTGLANRRHFDLTIASEINRARRAETCVALLLIDIDHFKRFNDLYGHPAGDACIRAVADAIAGSASRAGELAARYGGEELAVLLPGANLSTARTLAERMRMAVRNLGVAHEGNALGVVTVSIGVHAMMPGEAEHTAVETLIQAADQALYRAKEEGRDCVRPL